MKQRSCCPVSHPSKANKKRKTASNVFAKFKIVFNAFVEYQQAAEKSSLKAEAARERGERGRGGKSGEAKVRRIKNSSWNWHRFFTS